MLAARILKLALQLAHTTAPGVWQSPPVAATPFGQVHGAGGGGAGAQLVDMAQLPPVQEYVVHAPLSLQ